MLTFQSSLAKSFVFIVVFNLKNSELSRQQPDSACTDFFIGKWLSKERASSHGHVYAHWSCFLKSWMQHMIILVLWWWIYTKMCTYNHYVLAIIECSYAHRTLANHAHSAKLSITGLIPLYSACGNQLTDMQWQAAGTTAEIKLNWHIKCALLKLVCTLHLKFNMPTLVC